MSDSKLDKKSTPNKELLKLSAIYGFFYSLAVLLGYLFVFQDQLSLLLGALSGVVYFCSSLLLYTVIFGVPGCSMPLKAMALLLKLPLLLIVLYFISQAGIVFGAGFAGGLLIHLVAFVHFAAGGRK